MGSTKLPEDLSVQVAPLPTHGAANVFVLAGTYGGKIELDRKKHIPWTLLNVMMVGTAKNVKLLMVTAF